jgi:hypothetical protein
MYEKGVLKIDEKLQTKIQNACDEKDKDRFQEVFEGKLKSPEYLVKIDLYLSYMQVSFNKGEYATNVSSKWTSHNSYT